MQVHVAGLHSHREPQHRLCEVVIAVSLVVNHRRGNVIELMVHLHTLLGRRQYKCCWKM